jgi:diguanylate cyclase
MSEAPKETQKIDYRERYELLLTEVSTLENNEQLHQTLLKTLISRVLFAVDKAYPELSEDSRKLRDTLRQSEDGPLALERLQPSIERLAEQIRAIEAGSLTPPRSETLTAEENAAQIDVRDFLPLLLERIAFTDQLEGRRAKHQ